MDLGLQIIQHKNLVPGGSPVGSYTTYIGVKPEYTSSQQNKKELFNQKRQFKEKFYPFLDKTFIVKKGNYQKKKQ